MTMYENYIEMQGYRATIVAPGEIEGVNIPYLRVEPENGCQGQPIIMFNNDGQRSFMDSVIQQLSPEVSGNRDIITMAKQMDVKNPIIMPILPSEEEVMKDDMQHLDQFGNSRTFCRQYFDGTIKEDNPFYRIDKQVDKILETECHGEKAIGFGHSGAGMAMLRYGMMNPSQFDKLVIGGNGDEIPIMAGENAKNFAYPLGFGDYHELFPDKRYDERACRSIRYNFYLDQKEGEPLREDGRPKYDLLCKMNYEDGRSGQKFCPEDVARQYRRGYGEDMIDRFKNVMDEYSRSGLDVYVKMYDDTPHAPITKYDFGRLVGDGENFEPVRTDLIQKQSEAGLEME